MCSVVSSSLQPYGLQLTRLLCPQDYSSKNIGVSCHFFLQGIFLTQGLNPQHPHHPHCQADSLPLSHLGNPINMIQFSSVAQSCPTLCNPMNCSTPGLLVHHQLREFTQTHVHRVSDAIQPSHPLSSPSPPAPNPSQHQSLFQCVNSLHEMANVLQFQLQHQSFQRTPRANLLQNGLVGSPCSPRDSQESSPTPQFKSSNSSVLSLLHSPTLTSIHDHRKNHSLDQTDISWQSNVSAFQHAIQVGHNFPSKE